MNQNKKNTYELRLIISIDKEDGSHYHAIAEVEIEAESLQEATDIVKRGSIEIQNTDLENGEYTLCCLDKNKFRIPLTS